MRDPYKYLEEEECEIRGIPMYKEGKRRSPEAVFITKIFSMFSNIPGLVLWVHTRGQYSGGLDGYGVADIMGVKNGVPFAIEIKASGDQQSDTQKRFEEDFKLAGGRYVLVRTIEEVSLFLEGL